MTAFLASDPVMAAAIVTECESWLGTPFVQHGHFKGRSGGVDCIRFVREVFANVGVPQDVPWPEYRIDESLHMREPKLERFLDSHPRVQKMARLEDDARGKAVLLDRVPLMPGDILGIRFGEVMFHLGIAVGGRKFIHCVRVRGVVDCYTDDSTFERRIIAVYRPLAV